ncbi:MAG: endopeptidase La [Clostridia bacterium]|nr:endopeptidase La [Clostridia bacterium]
MFKFKEQIPMPLIALRGLTVFPNTLLHFDVGRDRSKKALEEAMNHDQIVFLVAQKDVRSDNPQPDELCKTGTISRVKQILKLPGGGIRVMVEGIARGRARAYLRFDPFCEAMVSEIESDTGDTEKAAPIVRYVKELYGEYVQLSPHTDPENMLEVIANTAPDFLADYIAQNTGLQYFDKQKVLDELSPYKRIELVAALLAREIQILKAEIDIQNKVKEQLDKNQKDYVLREQLRAIKTELGEQEDASDEAREYTERIKALNIDPDSEEKLLKEASRLSKLGQFSAEQGLIRTYLDTVLELPWNKKTKEKLDVAKVQRSLEKDHFGMEKVKERIVEFVAVKALAPDMKKQIICLVGPPGVGKTSVGMSIAKATGRKLARISLGGVRDEADIRGHRKTYIGAMPGRIMTGVANAGSCNPVLLLDEIDKLGSDYKGDPSSALLEVLDSEQNHSFRDHYIEIPFDLSDVLFITTANTTETIPRPLLDRMEVIELPSYTDEEKLNIAKKYLIPKQTKAHGLDKNTFRMTDGAIRACIRGYTRESGVRTLDREIAACCRKIARRIAQNQEVPSKIDPEVLKELLGPKKFKPDRISKNSLVGVVNGLAWTAVGGELLEAEVNVLEGSGKLELTGNLGDIMKESAKTAISYIRSRAEALGVDTEFYKNKDIHVHFPEGAIPKDGPSAGITIATAIVSALTGRPVRQDVAMTGEITLRGRVLPIGGLREKTMAAYRSGIKQVIIPADNAPDIEEIDPTVREGIVFHPVSELAKVLEIAFDKE